MLMRIRLITKHLFIIFMRKLFSLLTCLVLAVQVWGAERTYEYNGLYYSKEPFGGERYLAYVASPDEEEGQSYAGLTSVVIPNTVVLDGITYTVVGILDETFRDCQNLTSVTFSDSLTFIGGSAFRGCTGLTSVEISAKVTSIGHDAFNGCTGLMSIVIPDNVESIGDDAFNGCTSLTSVQLPATYIGRQTFRDCSSLESIVIPGGVTSIREFTFYGCTSLTSITLPASVTEIGEYAFGFCQNMLSISIPATVTSMGSEVFQACNENLIIYCELTEKPEWGWDYWWNSEHTVYWGVKDANSIISDGNYMFSISDADEHYLTLLKYTGEDEEIVIPQTVTNDGIEYTVTAIAAKVFYNNQVINKVTIQAPVKTIGSETFCYCNNLKTVEFPESLENIGAQAFAYCEKLNTLNIPFGVKNIGYDAFANILNVQYQGTAEGDPWGAQFVNPTVENGFLYTDENKTSLLKYIGDETEVEIPDGVVEIGNYAFVGRSNITKIIIPNSVTTVGLEAFSCGYDLQYNEYQNGYYLGNNNNPYLVLVRKISDETESFEINANTKIICNQAVQANYWYPIEILVVPDAVTCIGDNAFNNVLNIVYHGSATGSPWGAKFVNATIEEGFIFADSSKTVIAKYIGDDNEIIIPDGVTEIGFEAFKNNSNITSVVMDDSLKTIGEEAFSGCNNLSSVSLPESLRTIGRWAFSNCRSLCISIPSGVETINYNAFENVINIEYKGTATDSPWGARFINANIEGEFLYTDSTKTILGAYIGTSEDVVIPNGVVEITLNAFNNNNNIKSVVISDSVKTIGYSAFNMCSNLAEVRIPSTVENISSNAFNGCWEVVIFCDMDSESKPDGWGYYWSDGCKMVVWKNTTYSVNVSVNYPDFGLVIGYEEGHEYHYGDTITLTAKANQGYYFANWADWNNDNPRTIIVTGNLYLGAEFYEKQQVSVNIRSKNTFLGTVSGFDQSKTYYSGDTLTLIATADEQSGFYQWSDGNIDNPRSIVLDGDLNLVAVFNDHNYLPDNSGWISIGGYYNLTKDGENNTTQVDLTFSNAENCWDMQFVTPSFKKLGKVGDAFELSFEAKYDGDYDNSQIRILAGKTFPYKSDYDQFNNTQVVDEWGYSLGNGDNSKYDVNKEWTRINFNYYLGAEGADSVRLQLDYGYNPGTISFRNLALIVGDSIVGKWFYTGNMISATAENGKVTGAGLYNSGEIAVLKATPNSGYIFKQWNDGNTDNPRQVVVDGNMALKAEFERILSTPFTGTPIALPGVIEFEDFDNGGSGVAYYDTDEGNNGSVYRTDVDVDIDKTDFGYGLGWTAQGEWLNYTVTVAKEQILNWSAKVTSGASAATQISIYKGDTNVTGLITAPYKSWYEYGIVTGQTQVALPAGTYQLKLYFETSDINVDNIIFGNAIVNATAQNGSVSGIGAYNNGDTATLTATAADGYKFVRWNDGNTDNPRYVEVSGNMAFEAEFEEDLSVQNITWYEGLNSWFIDGGMVESASVSNNIASIAVTEYTEPWLAQFCNIFSGFDGQEAGNSFQLDFDINWNSLGGDRATIYMLAGKYIEGLHDDYQWSETIAELVNAEGTIDGVRYAAYNVANGEWAHVSWGGTITQYGADYIGVQINLGMSEAEGDNRGTFNFKNMIVKINGEVVKGYYCQGDILINATAVNGTVTGGGYYNNGDVAELIATPNAGYKFKQWNDGNIDNPRYVEVSGNMSFEAEFESNGMAMIPHYEDKYNSWYVNGDKVGGAIVTEDNIASITISENGNLWESQFINVLTQLEGQEVGNKFQFEFDVNWNSLSGVEKAQIMMLTGQGHNYPDEENTELVNPSGGIGGIQYACYQVVNGEWTHVSWGGTIGEKGAESIGVGIYFNKFDTESDKRGTFNFKNMVVKINGNAVRHYYCSGDIFIDVTAEDGTVTGTGFYKMGEEVTLTAKNDGGYIFKQWDDGNTDNPRTITVTGEKKYVAIYDVPNYTSDDYPFNTWWPSTCTVDSVEMDNGYAAKISISEDMAAGNRWDAQFCNIFHNCEGQAEGKSFNFSFDVKFEGEADEAQLGLTTGKRTYVLDPDIHDDYAWNEGNTEIIDADGQRIFYNEYQIVKGQWQTITLEGTIGKAGAHYIGIELDLAGNEGFTGNVGDFYFKNMTMVVDGKVITSDYNVIESGKAKIILSANNPAYGTVSGVGSCSIGEIVTITANPNIGYTFKQWNDGITDNPRYVEVIADTAFTAEFESNGIAMIPYYEDKYNSWYVNGDKVGGAVVTEDNIASITVTENGNLWESQFCNVLSGLEGQEIGNKFQLEFDVCWNSLNGGDQAQIMMVTNKDGYGDRYSSEEENTELVNASGNNNGIQFATYQITNNKWTHISWGGTIGEKGAQYIGVGIYFNKFDEETDKRGAFNFKNMIVRINGNIVQHYYCQGDILVNVTAENGTVSGSGFYKKGDVVELVATPKVGYIFTRWNDGVTDNPRTITVDGETALVAEFDEMNYTSADFPFNTWWVTGCEIDSVKMGNGYAAKIFISEEKVQGYRWDAQFCNIYHEFDGQAEGKNVEFSFDVKFDGESDIAQLSLLTGKLTWKLNPDIHVDYQWDEGNTEIIDADGQRIFYNEYQIVKGQWQTISIKGTIGEAGARYIGLELDLAGNEDFTGNVGNFYFKNMTMVVDGKVITSDYVVPEATITLAADNNCGTVEGNGTYYVGDTATIKATANAGYKFIAWSNGDTASVSKFAVIDDLDLTAIFNAINYSITYNLDGGYAVNAESYTIESEAFVLQQPEKEGYEFTGWTGTELDGLTTEVTIAQGSTGDREYTANWAVKSFTISFDCGEGTPVEAITANFGDTITAPNEPTKEGFEFSGWNPALPITMPAENIECEAMWTELGDTKYAIKHYLQNLDGVNYSLDSTDNSKTGKTGSTTNVAPINYVGFSLDHIENATITEEGDAVAKIYYKRNSYTLAYDAKGGELSGDYTSGQVLYGAAITVPNDPTKEGYTFVEWNATLPETMPAENLTFTASWSINKHNIVYVVDGTTHQTIENVEYGATIVPITEPSMTGYTFSGWQNVPATMPDNDVTISGSFSINQYTITFNTNGGTTIDAITADYGTVITAPDDPTKEHYTFVSWDKAVPETMPAMDLTLKANWEINKHNIVYVVDGTTHQTVENVEYGATIVPITEPSMTGYTFSGWQNVPATMPDSDVTITGSFSINQYTITFNTNGGTTIDAITADYGTAITAPDDPTKEHYTFVSWDKTIPETMPAENLTITASWSINKHSIIYVVDGGNYQTVENVEYGSQIVAIAAPSQTGYTFSGWQNVPATMPDNDVTISGSYTINQYTITFDTDGGSEVSAITADYNSEITNLPVPTKEGYTFAGWDAAVPLTMPADNLTFTALWTINKHSIVYVVDGKTYKTVADVEFSAAIVTIVVDIKIGYTFTGWQYVPATMPDGDVTISGSYVINQYTITFDTDGGSDVSAITADYKSEIKKPANPTKENYTFVGWDREIPDSMPAENLTIKAIWTLNKHNIVYVIDGDTVQTMKDIAVGTAINAIAGEPKTGYTFSGWQNVPATMPDNDVIISGSFTINQYTITFDTDGGSPVEAITADYGTAVKVPANPTKANHTFAGWDKAIPETMPAENLTIKAVWEVNKHNIVYVIDGDTLPIMGSVAVGTAIKTIDVYKKTGYTFSGWQNVPATMPDNDVTISGSYTINQYTITFNTDGGSSVEAITADYGTAIKAPADPKKDGYTFIGWSIVVPDSMPAENLTIKAVWEAITFAVTLNASDSTFGTVKGAGTYMVGDTATLVATANEGYEFVNWSDGSTSNPYKFVVEKDVNLTANFQKEPVAIKTFAVKAVANDTAFGSVSGAGTYNVGDTATLVAIANEGYEFVSWSDSSTNNPYKFVVEKDVTLTANFQKEPVAIKTFAVKVVANDTAFGEVSGTGVYYYGDTVNIYALENDDYEFVGWSDGGTDAVRTIVVTGDVNLTAMFRKIFVPFRNIGGLEFYLADTASHIAELIGYTGSLTVLNIPAEIEIDNVIYKVKSIGQGAFAGCSQIDSIVIPETIETIGSEAFANCTGVLSINIPSIVDRIGDNAFLNVKNIVYYGSATGSPWGAMTVNGTIEENFILDDSNLTVYTGIDTTVVLPDSISSIGQNAFAGNETVTSVTIPESVTEIGDGAFNGCTNLESVVIPEGVTSIGSETFANCTSLDAVEIPTSVTEIGSSAFVGCTSLTVIQIPISVTVIGASAFANCSNLNAVQIPESVSELGEGAFINCTSLVSVSIPVSVTVISAQTFAGCSSLSSIEIPNATTEIGNGAFGGCSSLTSVSIPTSVTTIGNGAFAYCSSLVTVQIGTSFVVPVKNSVMTLADESVSIGSRAFIGCDSLTAVYIPLSVANIGDSAFAGCKNLTIYCEAETMPEGWSESWNPEGCTVVWNYKGETPVEKFNLIASANNKNFGSVSGSATYSRGETATITATAADGYKFVSWSDGNTDNPRTIVVADNIEVTAIFEAVSTNPGTAVADEEVVAVNIFAFDNIIVVENATDDISVYDANGRLITVEQSAGQRTEIQICNTGVYIVKVGSTIKRVMVF